MSSTDFTPLVSIVIPVFNGENYVRQAIDSAIDQSYKNIEIIVVNDGSEDETEQIVNSYGSKVRYFSKPNGGVASALNLAISHANGEYISWLSHDDMYVPQKIESQVKYLASLSDDLRSHTIQWSNYRLIDEESIVTHSMTFHKLHDIEKLNSNLYPLLNGLVHGCTLLIPKCRFDADHRFDESLKTTQDYDLWFRMFPNCRMHFEPEPLVFSRWHDEQGSKVIEGGPLEASQLWIKMIEGLSQEQMIDLAGSSLGFYQKTLVIMKGAGYKAAQDHVQTHIDELLGKDISTILVSVIIPFYNRIDWLMEAVNSVLEQTHQKFDLVLVNDGSTESIDPVKKLAEQDSRIRLVNNSGHKGASGARNTGLKLAAGDYITFLDSDDVYLVEKIHKQLEFMVRQGCLFSHTSYYSFSEGSREIRRVSTGTKDYDYKLILSNCAIATPTVMFKKELISSSGALFDEKISLAEDICFWMDLSQISICRGIDMPLTKVRLHECNAAADATKQVRGLSNVGAHYLANYYDGSDLDVLDELTLSLKFVGQVAADAGAADSSNEAARQARSARVISEAGKKQDSVNRDRGAELVRKNEECSQGPASEIASSRLKSKLKSFLARVSPSFRMLQGNRQRLDKLNAKISKLNTEHLSAIQAFSDAIDSQVKQLHLLGLNNEEMTKQAIATKTLVDNRFDHYESLLMGEFSNNLKKVQNQTSMASDAIKAMIVPVSRSRSGQTSVLRPKTNDEAASTFDWSVARDSSNRGGTGVSEYNCSQDDFFDEVSKYIIQTEVVLDIGVGIRPQNFFVPKVHLCIEPFGQYREIIRPLFPSQATSIFFREEALPSIQIMDSDSVDTVFMLDVIEHLEKRDGLKLLEEAERVARHQIVVYTPLGFYPMSYPSPDSKDAWGLNGAVYQEHKSGWVPEDFDGEWAFHICRNCHEAFMPEEREKGKKYSGLMAIRTFEYVAAERHTLTPSFLLGGEPE